MQILNSIKLLQVAMLNKFSEAIRTNLTKMQRLKIVALVTIEVHARDIIEKLAKTNCSDPDSFDWLCQLRFYWDRVSCAFGFNLMEIKFQYILKKIIVMLFCFRPVF